MSSPDHPEIPPALSDEEWSAEGREYVARYVWRARFVRRRHEIQLDDGTRIWFHRVELHPRVARIVSYAPVSPPHD